jgi:hypothetical protein
VTLLGVSNHEATQRFADLSSGHPTKRKRPWGAGVFERTNLGGSWVFHISTWRPWGAGKAPREFLNFYRIVNFYRTTDVFELVTTIGLPALMTRAVCVEPSSENV